MPGPLVPISLLHEPDLLPMLLHSVDEFVGTFVDDEQLCVIDIDDPGCTGDEIA